MKFYGERNGANDKSAACKNLHSTSALDAQEIPEYAEISGFYWLGPQPDGRFLYLIDFDPIKGYLVEIKDTPEILHETRAHRACRGGLHQFVFAKPSNRGNVHKKLNGHPLFEGIDINGRGQKCIAAGSLFTTSKGKPYTGGKCIILQDNEPIELNEYEMEELVLGLTGESLYGKAARSSHRKAKHGQHVSAAGKIDIPPVPPTTVSTVSDSAKPTYTLAVFEL